MARLRYNNTAGALGAALTTTGTQLTFTSAPAFATITPPDYIPLVIDPPQGGAPNPNFEIVYVTAYTAGQSSATLLRGQEGTTARAHNQGAIWAQSPTQNDLAGNPPVGSVLPYTGTGDPAGGVWVIADGRLIDRTIYSDFFGRTGHRYNFGADPGSNKVRIPDKRGKSSIGAINMGSALGAGSNDNNHFQGIQGNTYGESTHALTALESGTNGNGGTGFVSNDHSHAVNINSGGRSAAHTHATVLDPYPIYNTTVGTPVTFAGGANTMFRSNLGMGTESSDHGHNVSGQTGGVSANHNHALSARNADSGHNIVHPVETDAYIVRIA